MKQSLSIIKISVVLLVLLISFGHALAEDQPIPPSGPAPAIDAQETDAQVTSIFQAPAEVPVLRPNHPPISEIPPVPMPEMDVATPASAGPGSGIFHDLSTKETIISDAGQFPAADGSAQGEGYCGADGDCGDENVPASMTGCMSIISNTGDSPWRMNVKVIVRFGTDWGVCSGTMRDAETVLTAGHCVYDYGGAGWANEVWVYPGWDGNDLYPWSDSTPFINPYGYGHGTYLGSWAGWTSSGDNNYDIGVIGITRAVGMLTGWFGYAYGGDCASRTSQTFHSASYPSQDCGTPGLHNGADMYYWYGTFNSCPTWNRLRLNTTPGCSCAIWGGQSGGGAYYIDGTSRYVHAVTSTSNRSTVADYTRQWSDWVSWNNATFIPNVRGSAFDLQPLDMNAEPTTIVAGQATTLLNHLAVNPTNGTKNATFTYRVYLSTNDDISTSDTLLSTQNYTWNFGAMGSVRINMVQVTIPATTPAGKYWLGVVYDSATDGVSANNSTDTWDAVPITVSAAPDLIVQSIVTNPVSPVAGQSAEVTLTIKNQGGSAAGGFYTDFYKHSDTTPIYPPAGDTFFYLSSLAAGATKVFTFPTTYDTAGSYKMWALIDSESAVTESNESNNVKGPQTITVVPPPQPPLPPTNLVVNGVCNGMKLTWNDNSNNESGFRIEWATTCAGPFVQIATVGPNVTTYTDIYGNPSCYRVKAYNGDGDSTYSNTASGVPADNDDIRALVREYYLDILDREPDAGGWDYWTDEICRILSLGIYVGEGFQAEARLFFNSDEYIGLGKSDTAFVIDLYQTFLQREPDSGGLTYWVGQLSCLTRNMLITQFSYSAEFISYMEGIFGPDTTRPENNMVNDFYRGFLNRLPDNGGYNSWLAKMREAQCTSADAVQQVSFDLSFLFVQSAEYALRGRNNVEYVEDLYNAILRRGADCAGFNAWVANLNSGMSRLEMLGLFTDSPEFQTRVDAVIAAGCILPSASACEPQSCGAYTDCAPAVPGNCLCFEIAEGGGACINDFTCGRTPCPGGSADCPPGEVCTVNTCCPGPVCAPLRCTGEFESLAISALMPMSVGTASGN